MLPESQTFVEPFQLLRVEVFDIRTVFLDETFDLSSEWTVVELRARNDVRWAIRDGF